MSTTGVNEFEGEQEYETEPALLKSSRPPITIAMFISLALIGAGAALFWHKYGNALEALACRDTAGRGGADPIRDEDRYDHVAENCAMDLIASGMPAYRVLAMLKASLD